MKKIITLISVLLVCITTFGQFPQNPTQGQTQIKQTNLGAIEAQRGLKAGQFVDTSAANDVLYMKGVAGILIYTTSDNNYWYRSADTMRWELIATTTSNCAGTQLISGSITWSGSGLVYDATDLDYYILCSRYFANSTTLTLAVADPTYGRIDKFYADNTQNIGVITGTPSANPQEPSVNPLTQIDLGFVYIPAGSTVPAGTTQTVIYNENVEWTGTSDVPSINFAYATNPYIGSLSTYIPSAPNDSYISWQYGTTKRFIDVQYLKLWVRINEAFVSRPSPFLDVSFYNGSTKVSADSYVEDGVYNFDFNLIGEWQLVSIPLQGLVVSDSIFDKVNFVIHSAPTSFQLDYVYLLETATIPPAPVGGTWLLNGNSAINDVTQYIGTRDAKKLNFGTNGQIRAYIDTAGIELLIDDTTANVMLIDSNGKIRKTYQPTILADSPLVIYLVGNQRHIKADTSRRGAAVATQYYADSVANAGSSGWSLTGNAGTDTSVNFFGTTDNRDIIIKRNNIRYGYYGTSNIGLGLYSLKYGNTGSNNTSIGNYSMFALTTGISNTAVGFSSLSELTTGDYNVGIGQGANRTTTGTGNVGVGYASLNGLTIGSHNVAVGAASGNLLTTGVNNTLIGDSATTATSSTDSSVAIGSKAVASTKQVAFSPHLTTMFLDLDSASGTAPSIAGIDKDGNWRKYATPSGGSPALTSTYVGVGNVSNVLSGSANFTEDGAVLTYNGAGGVSIPNGGLSVAGGTITAIDYIGDWTGSVINPLYGGTGVNNGSNTITLGGNLTTSGAFASTFTMTAATGVTFPTTGTLATLAGSETFTNKDLTASTNVFPSFDYKVLAYNAMGSTIVAQNVDGDLANGVSSQTMADARVYFSAVYLPKATTLTGVKWYQVTAGSYTGDAYNGVGLYTYSGGTLTLVASSTNDANIWTATGGTIASKAFSSTYAASAGLYFVAYLYNNSAQTTAPVLGIVGGASTINTVTDFTNSAKTSSLLSSQTALPSPTQAMSGLTAAATEYKAFLY